ncbi:MAG: anthrone oxygenase family protein [Pyrinomonadaceae bacterium]
MKRILLFVTVLFLCFHLTGHVYESLVLVPNWKSGEVADVVRYVDFIRIGMPSHFFAIAQFGCLLLSLVTFIAAWSEKEKVRMFAGLTLLISVIVMAGTFIIFVPINIYMGSTTNFDPVELKTKVTTWVNFEYVRIAVIALGLVTSIAALEFYERKSRSRS